MTAIVPSSTPNTKPPEFNPSLTVKAIATTIGTGIGMVANYYISYGLLYPFERFGSLEHETRVNYSALAALSVPIRPLTSFCNKTALGCNENTPWRNITENVATSLITCIHATRACNYLGYNIKIADLLYHQIQIFGITALSYGLALGIQYLDDSIEVEEDSFDLPEEKKPRPIEGNLYKMSTPVKTAKVSQMLKDENK
jgi:hypothetical protein